MTSKVKAIARTTAVIVVIVVIIVAAIAIYYAATVTTSKTTSTTTAAALTPISIALVAPAQFVQLPVYIALYDGYFAQNGLKVTLDGVSAGPPMFAALTSKSVQFTMDGWSDTVTLWGQGEHVQSIFAFAYSGDFSLVTLPGSKYTTLASLQGQNVGVNGADLTQWMTMAAINASGYNPNAFCHFVDVQIGGASEAALKAGTVVATLEIDPITTALIQAGNVTMTYDMRNNPVTEIPAPALVGLSSYVNANPKVVNEVIKSLLEADQFMHSNETGALAVATQAYQGVSMTILESMYTTYMPVMPVNGTAPVAKYHNAWDMDLLAGTVNATSNFQTAYGQTVNNTYIADNSG